MKLVEEFGNRVKLLIAAYCIEKEDIVIPPQELAKIIEGRSCMMLAKELHKSGVIEREVKVDGEMGTETYFSKILVLHVDDFNWIIEQIRNLEPKEDTNVKAH